MSYLSTITNLFYFPFAQAEKIIGKGHLASDYFDLPPFCKIQVDASISVHLQKGERQEVILRGYENLLDYARLEVFNDTLSVRLLDGRYRKMNLELQVILPEIRQIITNDAGSVYVSQFEAFDSLDLEVNGAGSIKFLDAVTIDRHLFAGIRGSGQIQLTGACDQQKVIVEGAGCFKGIGLVSQNAEAKALGAGHIKLTANKTLDVYIEGVGNIYFQGYPSIEKWTSGIGRLIDKN
ncbi:MAG: head GIN domain-containing protein [Bacteroidota bacterium]